MINDNISKMDSPSAGPPQPSSKQGHQYIEDKQSVVSPDPSKNHDSTSMQDGEQDREFQSEDSPAYEFGSRQISEGKQNLSKDGRGGEEHVRESMGVSLTRFKLIKQDISDATLMSSQQSNQGSRKQGAGIASQKSSSQAPSGSGIQLPQQPQVLLSPSESNRRLEKEELPSLAQINELSEIENSQTVEYGTQSDPAVVRRRLFQNLDVKSEDRNLNKHYKTAQKDQAQIEEPLAFIEGERVEHAQTKQLILPQGTTAEDQARQGPPMSEEATAIGRMLAPFKQMNMPGAAAISRNYSSSQANQGLEQSSSIVPKVNDERVAQDVLLTQSVRVSLHTKNLSTCNKHNHRVLTGSAMNSGHKSSHEQGPLPSTNAHMKSGLLVTDPQTQLLSTQGNNHRPQYFISSGYDEQHVARNTNSKNLLEESNSLSCSEVKEVAALSPESSKRVSQDVFPNRDRSNQTQKQRSPAFVVPTSNSQRWQMSAQQAHTKLQRMSPKAIPSVFTYQDEDNDVDVAIQFFEQDHQSISGQAAQQDQQLQRSIDLPREVDAGILSKFNGGEYQTTIERYLAEGRVYVELRYCRKCQNNQPLRAKHCRKCERCVSTFDHHCPWVGNCVGERNKKYFYSYIWFQLALLAVQLALAIRLITEDISVALGVICIILACFFILFVLNLVLFHSYILTKNMTTWEMLSWNKISYLQHWPRRLGSPFDLGCRTNWSLFYCYRQKVGDHFLWKMPYRRPDLDKKSGEAPPRVQEARTS